ncbi:MAG: hypothetical protein NTY90_00635 [Candidatus Micrarchaeota archaeon]|nr:hypothetical protein [Candidatus Micrarchaeota archaeon]
MPLYHPMQVGRKSTARFWRETRPGTGFFEGHRVVKDGKMLVVNENMGLAKKSRKIPSSIRIMALPKPEHFEHFKGASKGVLSGGPSTTYDGAVGSLTAYVEPENTGFKRVLDRIAGRGPKIYVYNVQAHYRTSTAYRPNYLQRKLATLYGGWRVRCLAELMRTAGELRSDVIFEKSIFRYSWEGFPRVGKKVFNVKELQLWKDIEKVSRKLGARIVEKKDAFVIKPPKPRA